jgi:protein SCO1/2
MRNPSKAILAVLALTFVPGVPATAEDAAAKVEPPCEHCHPAVAGTRMKRATRSTADYALPRVGLVRDDGKTVSFPDEIDDGRPVVLNFIFTSCTSICPVMSSVFSGLQSRLGEGSRVHLVSISIDPEQDTPARLAAYARKFHAGPQWQHYTGTVDASVAVQRAFEAYRGDKMSHTAVTYLRAAPGRPWVRIDGYPSSEELAREFQQLVASR